MTSKIANDKRIDPRLREAFADVDLSFITSAPGSTREQLMEYDTTEEAIAAREFLQGMNNALHYRELVTADGLVSTEKEFISEPDGNTIKVQYIRPATEMALPCVYYIHGGGMEISSAFDEVYQAWGRCIARQNVAVAMVDFRNARWASSAKEVAPFPAGLNDCVSGIKWLHAHSDELNIDPTKIIMAGDSGGGNLALATALKLKREGILDVVSGLYTLCPYIAGRWPLAENPSSIENEGILLSLHNSHGPMAYGIEELENQNPLAWPGFCSVDDVKGFPRTFISVHECDPLRDEGINFYRLLVEAGVEAQCRQVMGAIHGTEVFLGCMEISNETASSIANFCAS